MRVGLKSLLGGAHCFALHPFFVAWGWTKLYGFPWDSRLWTAFGLHDIGYITCTSMDGDEGEKHVVLGAQIMGRLFGPKWESECFRHSRYWCRRTGLPISRLCLADKLAFALTPAWLYLPMARWTGELAEYMERSRDRQAGDTGFTPEELADLNSGDERRWLRGLQSYTLRWVDSHRGEAVEYAEIDAVLASAVPSSNFERFHKTLRPSRRQHMPKPICDFCSSPNVTWVYPAQTFAAYAFEGIVGESVGDWTACPICHGLIESGRHTELADRSLVTLLERQPEMKSAEQQLRAHIRSFHTMFFRNRVGSAMTIA